MRARLLDSSYQSWKIHPIFLIMYSAEVCVFMPRVVYVCSRHTVQSTSMSLDMPCTILVTNVELFARNRSHSNKIYTQFYDYFDILLWSSSSYSTISLHPVWVLYVFCVPDTFSFYYYYYDCSHEYN